MFFFFFDERVKEKNMGLSGPFLPIDGGGRRRAQRLN